MAIKEIIKQFASERGLTLKEVSQKAGLSYNGLHNKFHRGSLTVNDLIKLLDVLQKEITFRDKKRH